MVRAALVGAGHDVFAAGVPEVGVLCARARVDDRQRPREAAEICAFRATDAASAHDVVTHMGDVTAARDVVFAEVVGITPLQQERLGNMLPMEPVRRDRPKDGKRLPAVCRNRARLHVFRTLAQIRLQRIAADCALLDELVAFFERGGRVFEDPAPMKAATRGWRAIDRMPGTGGCVLDVSLFGETPVETVVRFGVADQVLTADALSAKTLDGPDLQPEAIHALIMDEVPRHQKEGKRRIVWSNHRPALNSRHSPEPQPGPAIRADFVSHLRHRLRLEDRQIFSLLGEPLRLRVTVSQVPPIMKVERVAGQSIRGLQAAEVRVHGAVYFRFLLGSEDVVELHVSSGVVVRVAATTGHAPVVQRMGARILVSAI